MTEWLTTGQMLDELTYGEIANSKCKHFKVKLDKVGNLIETGLKEEIICYGDFLKTMWQITYDYVSFTEAMKALEDGKSVCCHGQFNFELSPKTYKYRLKGLSLAEHNTLHDLVNGKWTIRED